MPEDTPIDQPGHLDIDAVSAFIDRDLEPIDLTTIAFHLAHCPACDREVLEIRTTVVLLGGLPQYEPRRSFCLDHEHARASRRRVRRPGNEARYQSRTRALQNPAVPMSVPSGPPRGAGWLPALHAAALVTGVLLLLVTVSDLTGYSFGDPSSIQLAAPTAAAPAPPVERSEPAAAMQPDADAALDQATGGAESAFQASSAQSDGTGEGDNTSQGGVAEEEAAPAARVMATFPAAAAVTRAIPSPATVNPSVGAESAAAARSSESDEQPSRLRIVQLALVLALAWLIVSIAGVRWVRRPHKADVEA